MHDCCLKDLCPQEKEKVAKLIRQVLRITIVKRQKGNRRFRQVVSLKQENAQAQAELQQVLVAGSVLEENFDCVENRGIREEASTTGAEK